MAFFFLTWLFKFNRTSFGQAKARTWIPWFKTLCYTLLGLFVADLAATTKAWTTPLAYCCLLSSPGEWANNTKLRTLLSSVYYRHEIQKLRYLAAEKSTLMWGKSLLKTQGLTSRNFREESHQAMVSFTSGTWHYQCNKVTNLVNFQMRSEREIPRWNGWHSKMLLNSKLGLACWPFCFKTSHA